MVVRGPRVESRRQATVPRAVSESPLARYLERLHDRHRTAADGAVATYIPELGRADPHWFGIAVATLDGAVHAVGDADRPFTIQSISKPLMYALILDDLGEAAVRARIGVEPTGDAFNAIALAPATGTPLNPMVNAGAIAAAALFGGTDGTSAQTRLLEGMGRFVGHPVEIDADVLESERASGHRNRAIGHLLRSSGAIDGDPMDAVDRYFVQCSVSVTAIDLAVIAATLANGGVNPLTGVRAASAATVRTVLSVMATCGMYDGAGDWHVNVGLPAKSGVAGGLLAVVPGRLGLGVFSPPLDAQGNSVRAARVCRDIVRDLQLHPLARSGAPASPIRAMYSVAEVGSRHRRSASHRAILAREGARAVVLELQGTLGFLAADAIADRLRLESADRPPTELLLIDLRRVERIEGAATELLAAYIADATKSGVAVCLSGSGRHALAIGAIERTLGALDGGPLQTAIDLDAALEAAEDQLLGAAGADGPTVVCVADQALFRDLSAVDVAVVDAILARRSYARGEPIIQAGDTAAELFIVERGRCRVTVRLPDGGARRLTTMGPGSFFGETALIGPERRGADVTADTPVDCLVLSTAAFDALRERSPAIATTILRSLLGSAVATAGRLTGELAVLAG